MKVIILAGGLGTRISEETSTKPKPMVKISNKPILTHIMNIYASQIDCEFLVATGYLSKSIEDYLESSEFQTEEIQAKSYFTGNESSTGERVRQIMSLFPNERMMVTYGDGLSNINLRSELDFHESHGKFATLAAVRPAARFGRLEIDGVKVVNFSEKSQSQEGWINGGFFIFEPEVIEYLNSEPLEQSTLSQLADMGNLMAYKHYGFWRPMDTLRERQDLEELARSGEAPWVRIF